MGASITGQGEGAEPGPLPAALVDEGFVRVPPSTVTTTVLDTFDGRLHAAELRLERRGDVLVLGGDHAVTAQVPVSATPRFPTELAPGPFRNRLAELVDIRALLPLITVTSRRSPYVRRNGQGKIVASAVIHERVSTPLGPIDGWFVEVDQPTGYEKQAAELLELVRSCGVRPLDDGAGIVDLAMTRAGVDPAGHRGDPSVPLDGELPALDGFRLVLDNLRHAMVDNRPGTIDDIDPEFLHDFRVAVRRTRSVLGHAKHVLPADVLDWSRDGFRALGQVTGPARDLDVYVLEWDRYVAALAPETVAALDPVRRQLEADRDAAHGELAAALRSSATTDLLERWRSWLAEPPAATEGGPHGERPVGAVVTRRIVKAQDRLLQQGRAITPETPADDVHELRKDAKKLRYLLECFGGLLRPGERKAFVKRLKELQDNLGEHQDAAVHVEQLREVAGELPTGVPATTFVAIGQLIEQLDRRRQAARDEFAERFTRYDSAATHQAFDVMLAGADR
ncbi:MAG: CHAD domain-containing protein [Ilumatobacteraceae bacterium]